MKFTVIFLGAFFYRVYEFFFSFSDPPPIVHRPCLPARYAIKFIPATNLVIPIAPAIMSSAGSPIIIASTDYSVVSSANFVPAAAVSLSSDYSIVSSVNFVPATSVHSSSPSSCIVPTH